ncbi:MAG: FAD-binding oxidoreductase [Chromatiales bacterium]|nr:MAG: FAD-binding oxidoreductase [Chromatiales bacterium]
MSTPTAEQLTAFGQTFSGKLLQPEDGGYDEARQLHNGMVDKRPALIAQCRTAEDIAAAVLFGREHDLAIAVHGGGHNVAGRATVNDGLMIDLSPMKIAQVDPRTRVARAQTGMTWRDLNAATQEHGLATTGGAVSTTGIAGLTLGGGYGYMMPLHGLAVDAVISAEMVLADGRIVTASADENPELFWGIRGGGGNFGVAASLEYSLKPIGPAVTGGHTAYPCADAREVLRFFRDQTDSLPPGPALNVGFLTAPDDSRSKLAALVVGHCGSLADGAAVAKSIKNFGAPLMDTVGPMSYEALNTMLDGSFPRGIRAYWRSFFLPDISDAFIDVMVDAYARCPSPDTVVILEHWYGAAVEVPAEATAFPHREEGYNLLVMSQWHAPAADQANIQWTRQLSEDMEPFKRGNIYMNYLDHDEGNAVPAAYGSNYARLQSLKTKYDPDNVFRLNQNIKPMG